jgi:hypothetical protein
MLKPDSYLQSSQSKERNDEIRISQSHFKANGPKVSSFCAQQEVLPNAENQEVRVNDPNPVHFQIGIFQ